LEWVAAVEQAVGESGRNLFGRYLGRVLGLNVGEFGWDLNYELVERVLWRMAGRPFRE
jgi:hypothetical protein